jgi:ABC-type lipoprotein export system ATPase subunit
MQEMQTTESSASPLTARWAPEPVLQLRNGFKSWQTGDGTITCLRSIELSIHRGESLAVVGPSGSGKSTLLHVLSLLTPLDSGFILLEGREVCARMHGADHHVRRMFGLVFQDGKLIPSLNVYENVCVPLVHQGIRPSRQKVLACAMIERVGLSHRIHQKTNHLSGGEMIRAAIARALVLNPPIVLADEPTGTLDSRLGGQIGELLFSIAQENRALVMVTHNEALACQADRILHITDGCITTVAGDRRKAPR